MILVCFQNCSQTHFSSDPGSAVFKTENTTTGGNDPTIGIGTQPSPSPTPASEGPIVGDNPQPSPTPASQVGSVPGNNGNNGNNGNGKGNSPQGSSPQVDGPTANLVECEMISPSTKIILDYDLVVDHSNSSATRVCMTTNACLNLINAYAVQHDCSLSLGAASSQAGQTQCTEIFPGSKGTCHNAAVLSDDQVNSILQKMSSK